MNTKTWFKNYKNEIIHVPPYFPDSIIWPKELDCIPDCCKNCAQHPSNGGKGICKCNRL